MKVNSIDLYILVTYMIGVVLWGMWIGRRQRDVTDYVVSGRDLPWWAILGSIVATETSTVTFLSIPGFAWGNDLTWLQLPMGFIIGRFVVALLLLPRFFSGNFFTAYQVLHERFGGATKTVTSLLFIITRTLADGLRLYLTAIVLWKVIGLDLRLSVICIGIATIVYTFVGGMRAVVWTDFVQFLVYMSGAVITLFVLGDAVDGGWSQILDAAGAQNKWQVFDFGFDWSNPHIFWAGLLGGTFLSIGSHGADQLMVQRYLSSRSHRDARRALIASGFVVFVQFAIFLVIGIGLWAFYEQHPPATPFEKGDHVFATFMVEKLPIGVCGIVLGAVFAAAMSTLSSSINSSATALATDVLGMQPHDPRMLRAIRGLTVLFGLAQITVGAAGHWPDNVVGAVMSIAGFTTGIILGVFFLGALTRRVDQRAALTGLLIGLVGMTAVKFGTSLAWPWFALVGSSLTFVSGYLASFLFRTRSLSAR